MVTIVQIIENIFLADYKVTYNSNCRVPPPNLILVYGSQGKEVIQYQIKLKHQSLVEEKTIKSTSSGLVRKEGHMGHWLLIF